MVIAISTMSLISRYRRSQRRPPRCSNSNLPREQYFRGEDDGPLHHVFPVRAHCRALVTLEQSQRIAFDILHRF